MKNTTLEKPKYYYQQKSLNYRKTLKLAQDVIGALLIVGISKKDAKKSGTLVVKKDISRGVALIEKSAAQGNVDALWQLGEMYSKGENVQRDELKAIEYFERAAGLGYVEDQIELAEKFEAGK